jgi:hypothetical protein
VQILNLLHHFEKTATGFAAVFVQFQLLLTNYTLNLMGKKTISSNKGKISESDNLEEFNFIYEEILKDSSETLNFICNE